MNGKGSPQADRHPQRLEKRGWVVCKDGLGMGHVWSREGASAGTERPLVGLRGKGSSEWKAPGVWGCRGPPPLEPGGQRRKRHGGQERSEFREGGLQQGSVSGRPHLILA